MTWTRALKDTARSGLRVERTRVEPVVALRGAAGVAVVTGLALWLESPAFAASSAFGAFAAGTATFVRSWRPRPVIALAAGTGLALSTFLGYLADAHVALFVVVLAVWAFLAGLAWAAGLVPGVVASLIVGIMLVTVTLPTSVPDALGHAAVIAFGGVVQAALILLIPVRRWAARRQALADAFAAVADFARRLRHDPSAPFDPEPLMTARSAAAVTPREARRRPAELHGSRGLTERIRPVLASLADPAVGAAAEGPERDRARELLAAAGAVLDAVSRSIRNGEPARVPQEAVEALRIKGADEVLTGPAHRAAAQLIALLGEVLDTTDGGGPPSASVSSLASDASAAEPLLRPTMPRMVPVAMRAVRGELRRDSPVLRHAVRLSVVASLGYLLASALPLGHAYWAPMASVMVMRPDFHQTYARVVARLAGTVVGVCLATGVVQLARPDALLSGALAVCCAGLHFLLMRTGYVASQTCVAAYVVFLLGMGGDEWQQTVPDRVLLTLLGGALAMLMYALYPAWETPRLQDRLADWLAANGRYAAAVIGSYADPAGRRRADVRGALLAARDARAAWEKALADAKLEPVRHPDLTVASADDANEALAAMGRAVMLLEAHLPERGEPPLPAAERFAETLREATAKGARDVRERRVPRWDPVEEALDAWEPTDGQDHVVRRGAELLLDALEDLTAAIGSALLDRGGR
ncbi:FUSC family protein [Streptomyces sp. NPDC004647]|uniref:FUSC family protein n=1 Tax=Streptomyces sp. NPDC004647 TaxID=3154671 RepID=UPI00339E1414